MPLEREEAMMHLESATMRRACVCSSIAMAELTDCPVQIFHVTSADVADEVSRAQRMLTEEYGTASNIKSRVNRLSVLSAITSTQERLKHYTRVPKNGLVVYCGTVITDEGKERKESDMEAELQPAYSN